MSKKLIAVASAAALALTGLVGIAPATAATPTVSFSAVTGGGATTGTLAAPAVQEVPDTNTLAKTATFAIANLETGDVVRVTASGSARINTAQTAGSAQLNVTTLGVTDYTSTRTSDGTLNLYISVTSTATSSLVWSVTRTGLTAGGTSYIKGSVGQAHFLTNLVTPAVLANTKTAVVSYNLTDVFGNNIDTATLTNAVTGANAAVTPTWNAVTKKFEGTITSASDTAFVLTIDGNGSADAKPAVAGFAASTLDAIAVVNNTTQAAVDAQVAALTAQIATMRSKAKSVTLKRWNRLVRKYNAIASNPNAKLKK